MIGLIAIPTALVGRWSSFWQAHAALELPPGVVTRVGAGPSPASNRNGLIRIALDGGADWLWFLDDDLVFEPNSLTRLLRRFDDPAIDCVIPLSFKRQPPFEAIWFTELRSASESLITSLPAPGPLVPIAGGTFGGLLVRTSALRRVVEPWVTIGQLGPFDWNDDLYFCRKLTAAGVTIWGDSTVRMGHTTDMEVWPIFDGQSWQAVIARQNVGFVSCPWGAPVLEPVA